MYWDRKIMREKQMLTLLQRRIARLEKENSELKEQLSVQGGGDKQVTMPARTFDIQRCTPNQLITFLLVVFRYHKGLCKYSRGFRTAKRFIRVFTNLYKVFQKVEQENNVVWDIPSTTNPDYNKYVSFFNFVAMLEEKDSALAALDVMKLYKCGKLTVEDSTLKIPQGSLQVKFAYLAPFLCKMLGISDIMSVFSTKMDKDKSGDMLGKSSLTKGIGLSALCSLLPTLALHNISSTLFNDSKVVAKQLKDGEECTSITAVNCVLNLQKLSDDAQDQLADLHTVKEEHLDKLKSLADVTTASISEEHVNSFTMTFERMNQLKVKSKKRKINTCSSSSDLQRLEIN